MKDELVITIDGPVGAGKSAVARALARRLGVRYLDTGAMYRAVTLKALRNQADLADPVALTRLAESSEIELRPGADGPGVFLDGEDVSREIRSLEVTNNAYAPSGTPGVRRRMVELQRRAAEQGPLVAEGRDMGTVVFPDSPAKFYLDASPDERARRRHAERPPRFRAGGFAAASGGRCNSHRLDRAGYRRGGGGDAVGAQGQGAAG